MHFHLVSALLLPSILSTTVLASSCRKFGNEAYLASTSGAPWTLTTYNSDGCPSDPNPSTLHTGTGTQHCSAINPDSAVAQHSYRFWGQDQLKVCFYALAQDCDENTYVDESKGDVLQTCKSIAGGQNALAYRIIAADGDCRVCNAPWLC